LADTGAPSLQVPDGVNIFSAQYARHGDDLVIVAKGSLPLTVSDYFATGAPAALEASNGAMLRGDVVELLAGPRAPAQYAQADAPEGAVAIGQVETFTGSSTATRVTGESVELGRGDPVFQGDVIQTGADSTLGIRLEDGTLASMSAHSRLVLNEFVFETGGSDNWMLVDLVEGAFAFLTGAIAPSGGMEITTPVAVMAIRGTMPVAFVAGEDGASQFFAASDQDYELLHLTTRELLTVITSAAGFSLSSPDAPLETIELDPETLNEIDGLLDVLNQAAAEAGLLGIQTDSGFHTYSAFGSIDGNLALIEFLLLLEGALTEEAVLEVEDPSQFLLAQAEVELIAVPDQAATHQMGPVRIDVLANDIHPEGGDLSIIFASVPSGHGTVEIVEGEDGQFLLYDPGTAFVHLAKDETFDVVITYTIANGSGAVASTTATVTITGLNDAPVITGVTNPTPQLFELPGQIGSDEVLGTEGSIDFVDVDIADNAHVESVSVVADGVTTGLGFDEAALLELFTTTMTAPSASTTAGSVAWTFAIADLEVDYLAEGEDLVLTYTVTIIDDHCASDEQNVTITITGSNDKPTIVAHATNASETVFELEDVTGSTHVHEVDGIIAFADVDVSDTHSATFAADGSGYVGSFALGDVDQDGKTVGWTFTVVDADIDHLPEGEKLIQTYTVTISDGQGGTVKQVVTITMIGANDAPIIVVGEGDSDAAKLLETDEALTAEGTLTVSDVSVPDVVTATVTKVVASGDHHTLIASETLLGFLTVTSPVLGTTEAEGTLTWKFDSIEEAFDFLADSEKLVLTYTVEVSDGIDTTSHEVTITIIGTNDKPIITAETLTGSVVETVGTPEADAKLDDSGTISFTDLDLNDTHTVTPNGTFNATASTLGSALGTLSASLTETATGGETGEITWTYEVDAALVEYLAEGEKIDEAFDITLSDGKGGTITRTVVVTITGTNDAPVISVESGDSAAAEVLEITGRTGSTYEHVADGTLTFTDVDVSDNEHEIKSISLDVSYDGEGTAPTSDKLLELFSAAITEAVSADGTVGKIGWTFSAEDAVFDFLDDGDTLVLTYTVTVVDDHGATSSEDVVITVHGATEGPIFDFVVEKFSGSHTDFRLLDVKTIGEDTIHLLLTPTDDSRKIDTSNNDVGIGKGDRKINPGEGVRAEVITNASVGENESLSFSAYMAALAFTTTITGLIGGPATVFVRTVLADSDNGDQATKILAVRVNGENREFEFSDDGIVIKGLVSGDVLTILGAEPFTSVEIVNGADQTNGGGDFLLTDIGFDVERIITGTDGNDFLVGTDGDDYIFGLDGDDVLMGLGGLNTLEGGAGNDLFVMTDLTIHDVIVDYGAGDVIDLTRLGFELAAGEFTAEAAAEFVHYDPTTGELFVDVDGDGDAADFELAAVLLTSPSSIVVRLTDGSTTEDVVV
jgi:VCBS repeat-containing protein